jgi:hypothetical protein
LDARFIVFVVDGKVLVVGDAAGYDKESSEVDECGACHGGIRGELAIA